MLSVFCGPVVGRSVSVLCVCREFDNLSCLANLGGPCGVGPSRVDGGHESEKENCLACIAFSELRLVEVRSVF